jgi:uncharacterized protein (TIGR02147 family)
MELHQSPKKKTNLSFQEILRNELIARNRKNPRYSLRAFAKSLEIQPSALSQMLSGRRPITEKMKLRLGMALGFSATELGQISASSKQSRISNYQRIDEDQLDVIADWYHYAILELTYLADFKSDAGWVAKRLGLSPTEARVAIDRLFRMGFLLKTKRGNWEDSSKDGKLTHISPGITSAAARKHQIQLLDLSKKAVQEVDIQKRNHTSMTMAIHLDDLPAAIERIALFRRQFAEEFQSKRKAEEVYQLQIGLFPLTKS